MSALPTKKQRLTAFLGGLVLAFGVWVLLAWVLVGNPGMLLGRLQVDADDASEEGRELLGTARDKLREHRTDGKPVPGVLVGYRTIPDCGLMPADLEGEHYVLANAVIPRDGGEVEIVAIPLTSLYPVLRLRFNPADAGDGEVLESWKP